ncbi:MAG: prolyl oligopeptidase family serine peptidase [Terriglobales bacterium]
MRHLVCPALAPVLCALATTVVLAAPPASAPALPPAVDAGIRALARTRGFSGITLSGNGKNLAWVSAPGGSLYLQSLEPTGAPSGGWHRVGQVRGVRQPVWSPSGRQLAFLASGASGQAEIYIAAADGSHLRRLTKLDGDLAAPAWSPSGRTLAFLYIPHAPRAPGPLAPMTPPSGVIESHPFEQRLATVDVATGRVRLITPPHLYIYQFDWAPDGHSFAAIAHTGSGDNNWWVARLYAVDRATGAVRVLLRPTMQIALPRFGPEGRQIAFIGGLMSDEGSTGGDIYLVPVAGGPARDITPGIHCTPNWFTWSGSDILFAADVDGHAAIFRLDPATGRRQRLWEGAESIQGRGWGFGFASSRTGAMTAVIRQSMEHPPEVWAGPIGQWRQITHANDALRPAWGKLTSLIWHDGTERVQGWLLYPSHFSPSRRYGLIVAVHGGPAAANVSSWPRPFFNTSLLSTAGYFVLYPNPRGSFGQGEAFTRANVKDFGYGDLRDIDAGVRHVLATEPVDPNRVGITGWSYGGYMTMWALTHGHLFHAAVAGAGVADWLSYYGENDIDQWMIPYFGASVYQDPAVYAKSSPMHFITRVHTPTLVLVGDRDGECPAPQSFEYWHALKTLGVRTELVVYQDEGHYIWKPSDQRDILRRTIAWFDHYLPAHAG